MSARQNGKGRGIAILLGGVIVLLGVIFFLARGKGGNEEPLTRPGEQPAAETMSDSKIASANAVEQAPPAEAVRDSEPQETARQAATPAPTPEATPSATKIVHGRVTSAATGDPVAGATISFLGSDGFMMFSSDIYPIVDTQTEEDGFFRLEVPLEEMASMRGMHALRAHADGYGGRATMYMEGRNQRDWKVDFALPYGGEVRGRVVTEDGKAVAGASVGAVHLGTYDFMAMQRGMGVSDSAFTESEADGSFVLAGFPEEKEIRIPALAEGYLPGMSDPVSAGDSGVEIVLSAGEAKLHGRVTLEGDQPIEAAGVLVMDQTRMAGGGEQMMMGFFAEETDADGYYEFPALPAGNLMVMATTDFQKIGAGAQLKQEMLMLNSGDDLEKNFEFGEIPLVTGRAYDAKTQEGVPGVRVSTAPYQESNRIGIDVPPDNERIEVVTGPDGKFEIKASPLGEMIILFLEIPAGWEEAEQNMYMPAAMKFIPYSEGTELDAIEVALSKTAVLRGRVLRPDATTVVPDATVGTRGAEDPNPATVQTDEEGVYAVNVSSGDTVSVWAEAKEGFVSVEIETPASGNPTDLDLTLEPYAAVSGFVRDSTGKGIVEAGIAIHAKAAADGRPFAGIHEGVSTLTGAEGYYYAENVPPAEIEIQAMAPQGSELSPSDKLTITLKPGEVRDDVNFSLGEADFLEGTVTNDDGEPIEGVSINATSQETFKQARTDKDGKYRITGLPPGEPVMYLGATHPEYAPQNKQNVTFYDNPHDFVLTKLLSFELVVKTDSGQPVTFYEYRLLTGGWQGYNLRMDKPGGKVSDPEGKTKLAPMGPGDWRVEVAVLDEEGEPTGQRGATEFTVGNNESEDNTLEVVIKAGRSVTGRVIMDDTEEPVGDAQVAIRPPISNYGIQLGGTNSLYDTESVTTNSAGDFTIENVMPGTRRVYAVKGELKSKEDVSITVTQDEDIEPIVLRMASGAIIYGVVTGRDGLPAEDVEIEVARTNNWMPGGTSGNQTVVTDAEGKYRAENLEEQNYNVSIDDAERGLRKVEFVQVTPGEETELNFDFSGMVTLTGTITIDGELWPQRSFVTIQPLEDSDNDLTRNAYLERTGNGKYRVGLKPGEYKIGLNSNWGWTAWWEPFTVAAEPAEQSRDFALQTADVDIVLVAPEGTELVDGNVQLFQKFNGVESTSNPSHQAEMTSERRRLPDVIGGEYRAVFNPEDSGLTGETEWLPVGPGEENVFVIFLEKIESEKIGGWEDGELSTDYQTKSWDATAVLDQPGEFKVHFQYESGDHAAAIEWVAIKVNGAEVARVTHEGWTGISNRGNSYEFNLESLGGTVTVEASIRSDGGTNSIGSVFIERRVTGE